MTSRMLIANSICTHARRTMLLLPLALATMSTPQAASAPVPSVVRNGRSVNVVLGARREPGIGLLPGRKGWEMLLADEAVGGMAELSDLTPGVVGTKWVVPVAATRILLDGERFAPTHAYRLEVLKDGRCVGRAIVYLYDGPRKRTTRISFTDQPPQLSQGELTLVPKGSL